MQKGRLEVQQLMSENGNKNQSTEVLGSISQGY